MLLAGAIYLPFHYGLNCIGGCGPYHNTASVADLDGDGDLDVVLSNLRHETETTFWAGPTLWINQGGGRFTPHRVDFGGPSTAAGDVDGDGDADIVQMDYTARLYLNQGGAQGGQVGVFANSGQRLGRGHIETAILADLDANGDLDALVGGKAQATIWWNAGRAGFQDSKQRLRYIERHGLAIGDFNGDGYLDIFSAAYDIEYHLWLNQGDGRLLEVN